MEPVIDLLARPLYGMTQVDRLLALRRGTARRWIDGYERLVRSYPPVVREESTGDEMVTWGEFVETRFLAEYRHTAYHCCACDQPSSRFARSSVRTPWPRPVHL